MKAGVDSSGSPPMSEAIEWKHSFHEHGVVQCRFGRHGRWLIAEWPHLARLTCDEAGRQVHLAACDGAPPRTLAKLRRLASVLVADLRGGMGVHASAVALGKMAVLLLGQANAGKSTAAAELCLKHGGRLLADDVSLLEERRGTFYVVPSERRHFLTPESGKALGVRVSRSRLGPRGKAAIVPSRIATRAYPLAMVAFLRFDEQLAAPVCIPLRGARGALRVIGSLYRFNLDDRRNELERVQRIFEQARVVEIARPRSSATVIDEILNAF